MAHLRAATASTCSINVQCSSIAVVCRRGGVMQIPIRQAFELLEQPPLTCIRKIATSFALVFLTLASVQLSAQSAASVTLVKAERLLDPRTGNVLTPAFVLIEGDKVKQVGSSSQIGVPSGAKIIDLG